MALQVKATREMQPAEKLNSSICCLSMRTSTTTDTTVQEDDDWSESGHDFHEENADWDFFDANSSINPDSDFFSTIPNKGSKVLTNQNKGRTIEKFRNEGGKKEKGNSRKIIVSSLNLSKNAILSDLDIPTLTNEEQEQSEMEKRKETFDSSFSSLSISSINLSVRSLSVSNHSLRSLSTLNHSKQSLSTSCHSRRSNLVNQDSDKVTSQLRAQRKHLKSTRPSGIRGTRRNNMNTSSMSSLGNMFSQTGDSENLKAYTDKPGKNNQERSSSTKSREKGLTSAITANTFANDTTVTPATTTSTTESLPAWKRRENLRKSRKVGNRVLPLPSSFSIDSTKEDDDATNLPPAFQLVSSSSKSSTSQTKRRSAPNLTTSATATTTSATESLPALKRREKLRKSRKKGDRVLSLPSSLSISPTEEADDAISLPPAVSSSTSSAPLKRQKSVPNLAMSETPTSGTTKTTRDVPAWKLREEFRDSRSFGDRPPSALCMDSIKEKDGNILLPPALQMLASTSSTVSGQKRHGSKRYVVSRQQKIQQKKDSITRKSMISSSLDKYLMEDVDPMCAMDETETSVIAVHKGRRASEKWVI